MSKVRRRVLRAVIRAACGLPFVLGALCVEELCAQAQSSGLVPPMSGDCAVVSGTGTITCTKTNGAGFAPSATVDATNAANLLSGTVAAARLGNVPNLLNPVTVPAGGGEYTFTDGAGTTVGDSSGNGNNLSLCGGANAPTWYAYGLAFLDTGQPGPGFNCVMTPFNTFGTVYFATTTPTQLTTTGVSGSYGLPASNGGILMGYTTSGNGGMNIQTQPSVNAFQPGTYSSAGGTNTTDAYAGLHVYSFSAGTAGGSLDRWMVDGQEPNYSTQVASAAAIPIGGGGVYELGTAQNNSGYFWRGVMTYMIVYPGQHTASQQLAVTRYIQARLAARASMPVTPVRSRLRTPQLIAAGDSLTATQSGTAQWTTALSTSNAYTVTNNGIAGITAFDVCKLADQQWAKFIVPGRTVVHFWLGTNDFAVANRSAADIWTSLTSCGLKAKQYGARTIAATMIDRGGSSNTMIANKNALNSIIRSNWKTSGAFDALNDFAEVAALGADSASANATGSGGCFAADLVHLAGPGAGTCTTLYVNGSASALSGYGAVAQLVSNAVNTLDGSTLTNPDVSASNAFVASFGNNFVLQTPTAAATHKLVDCQGQASARTVVNGSPSFAIAVSGVNSLAINGNATIAPQSAATFVPVLLSASAAGCSWLRVQ